ncbi:MAG: YmdB family metallophosphoesterase, partial [Candidatus Sumerlaeota bacterium]|nr:YmdB family metallophosphoesterase [Candidatus Sumerlaeota bacterium]
EQILPHGTAYITDVGMTGPHDGVIGIKKDIVLESMVSRLPVRHQLAEGNIRLNGVIVTIDPESGRATDIERLSRHA